MLITKPNYKLVLVGSGAIYYSWLCC